MLQELAYMESLANDDISILILASFARNEGLYDVFLRSIPCTRVKPTQHVSRIDLGMVSATDKQILKVI